MEGRQISSRFIYTWLDVTSLLRRSERRQRRDHRAAEARRGRCQEQPRVCGWLNYAKPRSMWLSAPAHLWLINGGLDSGI
jgi:hypothetical protein